MPRNPEFQTLIALLTAFCLTACTSMRAVPSGEKQAVRAELKVGDEVSVSAVNGKTYLLVLTAVDEEKITGVGNNQKVTMRYEQIRTLEIRKLSVVKTAGLSIGVIAGAFLVFVGLFVAGAFGEPFGD
ncbi:MAG: hypothetical protein V4650_05620 [Pseudomonadota bacterium]